MRVRENACEFRRFAEAIPGDFDEKGKTFKDKPRHDWTSHSADAFRYMAMAYQEVIAEPPPKPAQRLLTDLTLDSLGEAAEETQNERYGCEERLQLYWRKANGRNMKTLTKRSNIKF